MGERPAHKPEGFAGVLKNFQLIDIVQLCCLSGSSLAIQVSREDRSGRIVIRHGEILHAETDGLEGEAAFYEILGWGQGRFETFEVAEPVRETLGGDSQGLILEAARRLDEAQPAREEADTGAKLRVLIVEDSPIMAKILTSMFTARSDIEILGVAANGQIALEMLQVETPDLIVLDVNLPVMDGSTALKHIMLERPCPVVAMSNIGSSSSCGTILNFLHLGAVDFMRKPVNSENILLQQEKIIDRLHQAARARIQAHRRLPMPRPAAAPGRGPGVDAPASRLTIANAGVGGHTVCFHTLTQLAPGGEAAVLAQLSVPPALIPGICLYLEGLGAGPGVPMAPGRPLLQDTLYIGTLGERLVLEGAPGACRLAPAPETGDDLFGATAFDRLLEGAAERFGARTAAVLMSGARVGSLTGLEAIRRAGGAVIVQEPSTCMAPEPLQAVIDHHLATRVVPPAHLAEAAREGGGGAGGPAARPNRSAFARHPSDPGKGAPGPGAGQRG